MTRPLIGALVGALGLLGCASGDGGTKLADAGGVSSTPNQSNRHVRAIGDGASGSQPDLSFPGDSGGSSADMPAYVTKKACFPTCSSTSDCPQGAVACTNKTCIFCTSDAECAQWGGAQKCDVATGSCIMCEQDSHCSYYGQTIWSGKCDTKLKLCVRCTSDADCSWQDSQTKLCVNNLCVQCTSDADCASSQAKGCDTSTGFCSRCKSDAECCPQGQQCGLTCDPTIGACLCQTDQQCSDAFQQGKWECRQP